MTEDPVLEPTSVPPHPIRVETRRMWTGPVMTAVLAVLVEVLRGTAFSVPNPPAFLVLAVVTSTFLGGLRSGLLSGLLAWIYISYFFSLSGEPFRYSEENLRRVMVWAGTIPLLVVLVGSLKRKAEEAAVLRGIGETLTEEIERRTKSEQALRMSERWFRSLIENSSDAIALTDEKGTVLYLSPSSQTIEGFEPHELVGRNAAEHAHPDDLPVLLERFQAALNHPGQPTPAVWRRRNKDGTWHWLEGVVTNLLHDPAIHAVVTNYRDITDRKKAEEELRARETRLASIYETVADVIFVLAVENRGTYRFTSVNPAFQAVTGVPSEAVVGKLVSEVVPEPSLSLVLGKYREAIEGKRTVRWEETSDYPAGRLTGEVSVAPIFDTEGNCVLLVGAVHDITERKRAEAEIAQLNEDLERKISERTAQLKAANRELEAFTYSVSHDLRSPLRTISGFTQILLDTEGGSLSEQGRRYLGLVREGAVRMGDLIEDLLHLSRFSRAALERRTVDTAAMVADVIRSLQEEFAGRSVDFVVGKLPPCNADANLLRQVWLNLISNALKFTRGQDPARIEIEATRTDGQVVFSVRDNGVGFDMRYADKLFGVFQRLHRAEEYEGSGLGLAIVQRIVLRHGGTVEAKSKPGEGARFSFSLEEAPQGSRVEARPMEEER